MGNQKFRFSNILPTSLLPSRKSHEARVPNPIRTPRCTDEHFITDKGIPIQTFDQMLLLSSSSRSFTTERVSLCPKTEHALPHRPSPYKSSSNSDDSSKRRKMHSTCCHGIRLKVKSPRLYSVKNVHGSSSSCSSSLGSEKRSKGLSQRSVTVVKSSANPKSDFKESMVEMIVEHNITDLEGLEELLVSYLVLNSDEFHEVIVSVFKDILIKLLR